MTPQTADISFTDKDRARLLGQFERGLESFNRTQFAIEPREEFEGKFCDITVVFRENGDVVFQIFPKKKWPRDVGDGRALLTDMVMIYFGGLDRFSASYISELSSWGLIARDLTGMISYDKEHHVAGFARFVNQALADL